MTKYQQLELPINSITPRFEAVFLNKYRDPNSQKKSEDLLSIKPLIVPVEEDLNKFNEIYHITRIQGAGILFLRMDNFDEK